MSEPLRPVPVAIVVLDPRFVVSKQHILGGPPVTVLQIEHPAHGLLSFAWPDAEVRKLHEAVEVALTC